MGDDLVRETLAWVQRHGAGRLSDLGRDVFAVDFDDVASVTRFRQMVDELEGRGLILLHLDQGKVLVSAT